MEKLMNNENLWNIHELIFGDLDHDTVEICRKVCKSWNESESLKIISHNKLVKFIQDFGDKDIQFEDKTVLAFIPGWQKAVEKYEAQASIEDLKEVKDSLQKLVRDNGKCCKFPVHQAAVNGDVRLMVLIFNASYDLNARDDKGQTVLHLASGYGRIEIVQFLLTSSKDLTIDLNALDNRRRTALHLACENGRTEIVQLLMKLSKEFSIDLNSRDDFVRPFLHLACSFEIVQFVVTTSKYFNIDLNARDVKGCTALHEACFRNRTEIVQFLITSSKEFGIDLNARDHNGWSAFHHACRNARTETVHLLITSSKDFSIDLNVRDELGWTALHWTIENSTAGMEIVELITKNWTEFGININARNNEGMTPLDLAKLRILYPSYRKQKENLEQIMKMLEIEYSKMNLQNEHH